MSYILELKKKIPCNKITPFVKRSFIIIVVEDHSLTR